MTGGALDQTDGFIVPNGRRRACLTAAAIAFIIGIHVAGRIGAYCSPLTSDDSYIFTSFGCRMACGDVLYRDMSDIKPPGLFMVYALVYLVAPAVRASAAPAETVFLLLGYAAIYCACVEVYSRRAALAVTVLSAVTINYFAVTGVAIVGFGVAENFMVFPAAAAAWMYLRALRTGGEGSLIACGLFLGVDTCLKQTALPLVVALTVHWTAFALLGHGSVRRWFSGAARMFVGGCIGWAPAILLMSVQGTLVAAARLLTSDAGAMLQRGSAWPDEWRDVLPLWIVIAWGVWAVLNLIESRLRRRSDSSSVDTLDSRPLTNDSSITFLLLWIGAEVLLLWRLPLRSPHYYVIACVPFMLLAGAFVSTFGRSVNGLAPSTRRLSCVAAVVLSGVFLRPAVDEIVPRAITAQRNHDWRAEKRRFEESLRWGPIHFGRGAPFTSAEQTNSPERS